MFDFACIVMGLLMTMIEHYPWWFTLGVPLPGWAGAILALLALISLVRNLGLLRADKQPLTTP